MKDSLQILKAINKQVFTLTDKQVNKVLGILIDAADINTEQTANRLSDYLSDYIEVSPKIILDIIQNVILTNKPDYMKHNFKAHNLDRDDMFNLAFSKTTKQMTPREKATHLIETYNVILVNEQPQVSRQCAINNVNNIMFVLDGAWGDVAAGEARDCQYIDAHRKFNMEVLKELLSM